MATEKERERKIRQSSKIRWAYFIIEKKMRRDSLDSLARVDKYSYVHVRLYVYVNRTIFINLEKNNLVNEFMYQL